MLDQNIVDAYNARPKVDLNSIKTMRPEQLDRVKTWGSSAENLLMNRDLGLFINQFKFELTDALIDIKTHTQEDNTARISIANQLTGIDNFISFLKRAVYFKNRVVTLQNPVDSAEPDA
jgi:hypothetical protein